MKQVVANVPLPSRSDVLGKLAELSAGQITREQASAWAAQWVTDDADGPEVSDFPLWEVLLALHMADLNGGDRPYLYGEEDFREWSAELQVAKS